MNLETNLVSRWTIVSVPPEPPGLLGGEVRLERPGPRTSCLVSRPGPARPLLLAEECYLRPFYPSGFNVRLGRKLPFHKNK